ncbi:phage terminase large subunit [Stenotrophomonas maltophilia]|nr:phage terminase large subunit [Stenotrophomonas maltophilia]
MASRDVSFLTFFLMWARVQGWTVPLLHVRICTWLETCVDPERVLMVFRGAAKSTIYAVFKAWTLYRNRAHRSLVWSADNDTAGMLTADTINVLRNHPLCIGMLPRKPGAKRFSVLGSRDARNASMRAVGVTSNATGARADAVDFDDIEVPGNIETPEARLKLRQRISESTHIAVPGAQKTFIGTPPHPRQHLPGAHRCRRIPADHPTVRARHQVQAD